MIVSNLITVKLKLTITIKWLSLGETLPGCGTLICRSRLQESKMSMTASTQIHETNIILKGRQLKILFKDVVFNKMHTDTKFQLIFEAPRQI